MKRAKRPVFRYVITCVLMLAMMCSLIYRLGVVTLKEGAAQAEKAETRKERVITLKGSRGSILDRNGIVLAYSENSYNVLFLRDGNNRTSYYNSIYTEALLDAIKIIEDGGGKVVDTSYIRMDEQGGFYYDWGVTSTYATYYRYKNFCDAMGFNIKKHLMNDDDLQRMKELMQKDERSGSEEQLVQNIAAKMRECMEKWKSAEDAYMELREEWFIPEEVSAEDALKVISVRQEINLNNYKAYEPVTIAYDVSMSVVAQIEMLKDELPGLMTQQTTKRVYPYGETAAHILGYMQKSQTEEGGYSYTDYVGVSGIEKTMESYLTGATTEHQGERVIEVNSNGSEVREISSRPATNGNDVMLTIDITYQQRTEQALADLIYELNQKGLEMLEADVDGEKYGDKEVDLASTGAMVVLDASNGDVIAMASYPSFDPNWFVEGLSNEQYDYLLGAGASDTPLLNKAIASKNPLGSVFKMVTGVAGLMEGVITLDTRIDDESPYYYEEDGMLIKDNAPECWQKNTSKHAQQDIVLALSNSCNYFFFEVANRLGIEKLDKWANTFGLSSATEIELTGEEVGSIGGQRVLFDNSLVSYSNGVYSLGKQKSSLPGYVYNALKENLYAYLEEYGKEASDDAIKECALRLMELQDGSGLAGKGSEVRRILSDIIGIPEGISRSKSWVRDITSMLNEIQWKNNLTIRTGIGQGVCIVTPIAVSRYVAALVNGGTVYNVHIVDKVTANDGSTVYQTEPEVFAKIDAPQEYWQAVMSGLKGVVSLEDQGTAAGKFSQEFLERVYTDNDGNTTKYIDMISGKSGTAQVGNNPIDIENTSWFVTYAPRENPEIVIVVCVPCGISGSSSVPAIEDIITFYFEKKESAAPENLINSNSVTP